MKKYHIKFKSAIQTWMRQLGYKDPYPATDLSATLKDSETSFQRRIAELEQSLQEVKDRVMLYEQMITWAEQTYRLTIAKK